MSTALVFLAALGLAAACEVDPWVDWNIGRPALDVALRPTFGWRLSPACRGAQRAYTLRVARART